MADRPWESLLVCTDVYRLGVVGAGGREACVGPDGWALAAALATLLGVRGPGSAEQGQAEGGWGSW